MTMQKDDLIRMIRQEVRNQKALLVALYGGDGPEIPDEVRKTSDKLFESAERAIKAIEESE